MNKFLSLFVLMIGLVSCTGSNDAAATNNNSKTDRVEVIYFHGKQRCATCMAIEKNAADAINANFAVQIKDGSIVFKTVDISSPEGEKIADKYEVTWSSLFVNKWADGKETRNNLTEFAFANARNNPNEFKKGLTDKISQTLK